ncbi:hypothetical protein BpHYR1_048650 [Brachionus plicatilis]|uniref:SWIM-type domain-containing protein n=1 Tax=Brachionus plicatilis TaxID=10195 RepID=A0A3M7RAQ2_BRAPC|nr:hypothetical protein BpHYR1_048650 [Brachionus plicatilis]
MRTSCCFQSRQKNKIPEAQLYMRVTRLIFANIKIVNNENKYYVLLKPPYCSCLYFLEFGKCKHFICLCKLLNYYSDDNVREFVYVKKSIN